MPAAGHAQICAHMATSHMVEDNTLDLLAWVTREQYDEAVRARAAEVADGTASVMSLTRCLAGC